MAFSEGCHELNYAVIPGLKLPEVQKATGRKKLLLYKKLKIILFISYLFGVHKAVLPNTEGWSDMKLISALFYFIKS